MASFAQTVKNGEGLGSIQAESISQYLKVIHIGTTRIDSVYRDCTEEIPC
jgi:hypothetical protein